MQANSPALPALMTSHTLTPTVQIDAVQEIDPVELLSILIPEIITGQLTYEKLHEFYQTNLECYHGEGFSLPLTQFLEGCKPLLITVREIEPRNLSPVSTTSFSAIDGLTRRVVEPTDSKSLPLAPYWPKTQAANMVASIHQTLEEWLCRVMKPEFDWPGCVFPRMPDDVYRWEREVMVAICDFLNPSDPTRAKLGVAIELTFYAWIMIHSFAVPTDKIDQVYAKIRNPAYQKRPLELEGEVTARMVDRYLAILNMKKFRLKAQASLEHLKTHFTEIESTSESGVLAFCESFLFLLVLAQLQRSVLEHGIIKRNENDESYSMQDAQKDIKRMENGLALVIIESCVSKLRKVSRKMKAESRSTGDDGDVAQDSEGSPSRFFDRLQKITELCGKSTDWQTELQDIDEREFGAWNVGRLLRKFYLAVSQVLPTARGYDLHLDS